MPFYGMTAALDEDVLKTESGKHTLKLNVDHMLASFHDAGADARHITFTYTHDPIQKCVLVHAKAFVPAADEVKCKL